MPLLVDTWDAVTTGLAPQHEASGLTLLCTQALTTPNTGYAKLNLISEPAGRGPVLAKSKLNDLDSVPEVCDSKVTLPGVLSVALHIFYIGTGLNCIP